MQAGSKEPEPVARDHVGGGGYGLGDSCIVRVTPHSGYPWNGLGKRSTMEIEDTQMQDAECTICTTAVEMCPTVQVSL